MRANAIRLLGALVLVAVLPACATLAGHPLTYSAEAIEGWVVDAEIKRPLEGVIVTANWRLTNAFGADVGQMMVMESVTDASGRFYFPAWDRNFVLRTRFLRMKTRNLYYSKVATILYDCKTPSDH